MRLIDADALTIDLFKKAMDDALLTGNADMHSLLIQVVAHYPTVDAVPVIRCKDCRWNISKQKWVHCVLLGGMYGRTADNFCSLAEKRKEE